MAFNASKLEDNPEVLDGGLGVLYSNAAALSGRALGVSAGSAYTNAAEIGSGAAGAAISSNHNTVATLASKMATAFESPITRGLLGMPPAGVLKNADTGCRVSQRISGLINNPVIKTLPKVNSPSLAVAEKAKVAGAFGKPSVFGKIAEDLRTLESLPERVDRWHSLGPFGGGDLQSSWQGVGLGGSAAWWASYGMQGGSPFGLAVQGLSQPSYGSLSMGLGLANPSMLGQVAKAAGAYLGFTQRIGKWIEGWGRTFGGVFERLREFADQWPCDPYGKPVPFWNVRLYWMAQAAYEGDYEAIAAFLNGIGADGSADNVLFVRDLLEPTFSPKRLDKREAWERKSLDEASEWLRRRLESIQNNSENNDRKKSERPYEEESGLIPGTPSSLAEYIELENKRILRKKVRLALSERQWQVFLCMVEEMPYEEIAYRLGIGVSTVKTHAKRLRENPDLRTILTNMYL